MITFEKFEFEIYKPIEGKPGFCRFDRMATYNEIYEALIDYLKKTIFDFEPAFNWFDYVSINCMISKDLFNTPIETGPNCCIGFDVNRGNSEGYYYHLHAVKDYKYSLIITLKTLCLNSRKAAEMLGHLQRFVFNCD